MNSTNLALKNSVEVINADLANLSTILYNCSVLLYRSIPQKTITYAPFDNATVNYNYVPPSLRYTVLFGLNQIQTVISYYVDNVNSVLTKIDDAGLSSQVSNKINSLNQSIAQLNYFAISLYQGQQANIKTYTTPYAMSIRSALLLNNLPLTNINLVILYNINQIYSLNYIPAGVQLMLL